MVDIPERTESHGPVFIYGVEGEQIEEENDAYNDLRYDIGEMNKSVLCVSHECHCVFTLSRFSCIWLHCIGNHFDIRYSLYNNFSYYRALNNNQQFAWNNRLVNLVFQGFTRTTRRTRPRRQCPLASHYWYLTASSCTLRNVSCQAAKKRKKTKKKNIDFWCCFRHSQSLPIEAFNVMQ